MAASEMKHISEILPKAVEEIKANRFKCAICGDPGTFTPSTKGPIRWYCRHHWETVGRFDRKKK